MPQWALLSPSPDPRLFSATRASKSSSALPYHNPFSLSAKSLSKKHKKARPPLPTAPPRLQPLVFADVDLSLPACRVSPPPSPGRSRSAPGRDRAAAACTPSPIPSFTTPVYDRNRSGRDHDVFDYDLVLSTKKGLLRTPSPDFPSSSDHHNKPPPLPPPRIFVSPVQPRPRSPADAHRPPHPDIMFSRKRTQEAPASPTSADSCVPTLLRRLTKKRTAPPRAPSPSSRTARLHPTSPSAPRSHPPGDARAPPPPPPSAPVSAPATIGEPLARTSSTLAVPVLAHSGGAPRPAIRRPRTADAALGGPARRALGSLRGESSEARERARPRADANGDCAARAQASAHSARMCRPGDREGAHDVIGTSFSPVNGRGHGARPAAPAASAFPPAAAASCQRPSAELYETATDRMALHGATIPRGDTQLYGLTPTFAVASTSTLTPTSTSTTTFVTPSTTPTHTAPSSPTPPPPPTSTSTTTPPPPSPLPFATRHLRAAPSSWARAQAASEAGHGPGSASTAPAQAQVARNGSFSAVARRLRRWSAGWPVGGEESEGVRRDSRQEGGGDERREDREGARREREERVVRSMDGGRPELHAISQVGSSPKASGKLVKSRPVGAAAAPSVQAAAAAPPAHHHRHHSTPPTLPHPTSPTLPPSLPTTTHSAEGTSAASTTADTLRLRTVSHGKLTKSRPHVALLASTTATTSATTKTGSDAPTRHAKFIIGGGSDLDLPSEIAAQEHLQPAPAPTPARPPLVRSTAHIDPDTPDTPGRRRWTLARAIADEGVSDEGLIRELERMRAVGAWARAHGAEADEAEGWEIDTGLEIWLDREGMLEREQLCESPEEGVDGGTHGAHPLGTPAPAPALPPAIAAHTPPAWLAAQRVLLVCRELLLTEKRYLALMETLLAGHTARPPPPLMLHYAADLVRASAGVLADMKRAPGAAGVARAFLAREAEVETAYVRWCGVVGGWFGLAAAGDADAAALLGDGARPGVKKRRSRTPVLGGEEEREGASPPVSVSPLKRTVSTWRRSMPSVASLAREAPHAHLQPADDESVGAGAGPRRHAVRDLAILPTQRVTRYVLLYRDLLTHTPPASPARPLVERAIAAACRIAEKCDRAQGNAAFIVGAPAAGASAARAGSGASTSSRGSSSRAGPRGSRPPSPSTTSSASYSTAPSSAASPGSSAATTPDSAPAPVLAGLPGAVGVAGVARSPRRPGTGDGTGGARKALGAAGERRTSMSSVSVSLMNSMGLGRSRAGAPSRFSTPPPPAAVMD